MFTLWLISATWTASAPQVPAVPYAGPALYQPPQASSPYHAMIDPPEVSNAVAVSPAPVQGEIAPPVMMHLGAIPSAPQQPMRGTAQRPTVHPPQGQRSKIGHEHDYSWITGYLYYVHSNGGQWVLRYARLDQVDRHGGSVVLAPTVDLRNYREGDLVTVHGEVLREGRATPALGGALYRADMIEMIERRE